MNSKPYQQLYKRKFKCFASKFVCNKKSFESQNSCLNNKAFIRRPKFILNEKEHRDFSIHNLLRLFSKGYIRRGKSIVHCANIL